MSAARAPVELELELEPRHRVDAIDVNAEVAARWGAEMLDGYRRAQYCSLHTTAGFLEPGVAARLQHDGGRVHPFIGAWQRLFPPDAGYRHDEMHLRTELSEAQRQVEPRNADSHLTFIGSGLRSCVTYRNRPHQPVYLMELDGVNQGRSRRRRTTVVAFDREQLVASAAITVPVSRHAIDSVNLMDPRLGLLERVTELVETSGDGPGRVRLTLDSDERDAAITVNEYETLLMRHDLAEVLRNPLRFVAQRGRNMLRDPRAIPAKSLGYAKYDAVQVIKEMMDGLGISDSSLERLVSRLMAVPASRALRLKRSASMPVSTSGGRPQLLRGTYQTPILIQWATPAAAARRLRVTLSRFI